MRSNCGVIQNLGYFLTYDQTGSLNAIKYEHVPWTFAVAARGFSSSGAKVRGAAPPIGNIHTYNQAYINDTVTEVHNATMLMSYDVWLQVPKLLLFYSKL